ncbi:MAG: LuxR C-terminal-related transcriptional regulator [Bacteroidales bacterium]|nr:LuxR C-terminal-related transcriptional regulator [Bacteroidales bacterium]
MIRLLILVIIIVSASGGVYSLILLSRLRKVYSLDYLNSFFYYKILHFAFGVYGIIGGLAIREILLKYDFRIAEIESIAAVIPFFGVPFIIAAWYILIKTSNELISRKVNQSVAIIFFTLASVSFLVYGLILRKLPEKPDLSSSQLGQIIRIAYYSIDLLVKIYIFLLLITTALRISKREKRIMLVRFGSILAGLGLINALALHFAYWSLYVGLYFLLFYFSSDLALIILLKSYLKNNEAEFTELTDTLENLYQKYGISKRERQIITEICRGKTNQEIADELYISLQTVKDHTYNIFRKVNVRNRVQLTKVFSGT